MSRTVKKLVCLAAPTLGKFPLRTATSQHQLNAALQKIESYALDAIAVQTESVHLKPKDPSNWALKVKDRERGTTVLRQILMRTCLSRWACFSKLVFDPHARDGHLHLPFDIVCSESACVKTLCWLMICADAWLERRRDLHLDVKGIRGEIKTCWSISTKFKDTKSRPKWITRESIRW